MLTKEEIKQTVIEWYEDPEHELGYDEEAGFCVYRLNEDPTSPIRCSVGVLIPDHLYAGFMENNNFEAMMDELRHWHGRWSYEESFWPQYIGLRMRQLFGPMRGEVSKFLSQMQFRHDGAAREGYKEYFLNWLREQ